MNLPSNIPRSNDPRQQEGINLLMSPNYGLSSEAAIALTKDLVSNRGSAPAGSRFKGRENQPITGWQDILDIASEAGLEPIG